MSRSGPLRTVLLGAVLVLAACAAPTTGAPAPVPAAGPASPARPKPISMTGLDPCTVFTAEQLRQLGVPPERPRRRAASAENDGSAQCIWIQAGQAPYPSVYAQAVTFAGLDDAAKQFTDPTPLMVRGYRAVEREHSIDADEPAYEIYIDVADGQTLVVSCDLQGAENRERARNATERAADYALANLTG